MRLRTFIALVLLLPALLEAAALRAQSSRNSFLKVAVGDIRYVDKAHSKFCLPPPSQVRVLPNTMNMPLRCVRLS